MVDVRVTDIAMGTEIDGVVEFEELARTGEDVPTAVGALDLPGMQHLD